MYLKRIEMENFKSFGKKTVVEFTRGFNGICGPNGSGKSNITDAILFVLGPKSSKRLRAQRLADLIYDGGASKNPSNYCRVSLVFDNTDRAIPIESDEVVFTRVLRRGDTEEDTISYFYINGEKARLQDFTNLLSYTNLDSDGYNFVQQGDVTNIIKMTAVERRKILEEIAGISHYEAEIEKSEEKRKAVEENMEKIRAVLEEIKRNVDYLERERNIALQYIELNSKRRKAEKTLLLLQLEKINREINLYREKLESNRSTIETLRKEIEELNSQEVGISEELKSLGFNERVLEDLRKIESEINNIKLKIGKILMDIETREEKREEGERKLRKMRESLREMMNNKATMTQKINEKRKMLEIKKEERVNVERELLNLENKIYSVNDEIKNLKNERKLREEEMTKLLEEVENILREKEKLSNTLRYYYSRKEELESSLSQERSSLESIEWEIREVKSGYKSSEELKKEYERRIALLRERDIKLREEMEALDEEYRRKIEIYENLRARNDATEYSRAVSAILEARDKGVLRGIHGTIEELCTVDDKFSLAIEVAAGHRYYGIVVDDDEAASDAISFLKKNNLGVAIFLPLNKMSKGMPRGKAVLASKAPKSYGFAINLLKFDKKYEAAFWYVFGDTVVVEDLDTARKLMGGVRLVTLDGQLIEASGAIIGGSVSRRSVKSKGDLNKIREEIEKLRERKKEIAEELRAIQNELTAIGLEMSEKIRGVGSFEERLKTMLLSQEKTRKKIMEIENEISRITEEIAKMSQELEKLMQREKETKDRVESIRNILQELDHKIESLLPQNVYEKIRILREKRDAAIFEENSIVAEISILTQNLKDLENKIREMQEEERLISKSIKDVEEDIRKLSKEKENFEIEYERLEGVRKLVSSRIEEEKSKREKIMEKIGEIREKRERLRDEMSSLEYINIALTSRINSLSQKAKEIQDNLSNYNDVNTLAIRDEKALEDLIKDCEAKMKALEPVNFKSIEDYNVELERYNSFENEYRALVEERKELIRLVKDLDEKKKSVFLKVFEEVNKNFREIYSELTDGMEGELILENPEDPFSGGLSIRIKQGNKYVRIERLSGGEKSLTALALIFALQRYSPSPIYFLDEVDMFLDPVNAEAVAKMIKRSSSTAQFIVISLRKVTLKHADSIVGVTKSSDGVSRVYCARLDELELEENEGKEVSEYV